MSQKVTCVCCRGRSGGSGERGVGWGAAVFALGSGKSSGIGRLLTQKKGEDETDILGKSFGQRLEGLAGVPLVPGHILSGLHHGTVLGREWGRIPGSIKDPLDVRPMGGAFWAAAVAQVTGG